MFDTSALPPFESLVDVSKTSLYISLAAIAFNPTFWNIVARSEYRSKTITKIFGGNAYYGCYALALTIFSLGMVRDALYHNALQDQPGSDLIPKAIAQPLAAALFVIGQTLVISSTWALGVTGTFLGDYFGILMDHRVEGFPFNLLSDPMYDGSTMCFAATALWYGKPAGLFITAFVYIVYGFALRFEGPFTEAIYAAKAKREQKRE
ncbi:phospholipid methyltransferase [Clavulina sp. PMI_390]|nr:phospholipid methyltransferase [Clavulina sp. PMI_390]